MASIGRLLKLGEGESKPVLLEKASFVIGRHPECDLPVPGNKNLSQRHCTISTDDGKVFLTDTSTNGTLVDGNRVRKNTVELKHGDEIHLVFKKNDKDHNLAYLFQELEKTMGDTLDATQEYQAVSPEPDVEEPPAKQSKISRDNDESEVKKSDDAPDRCSGKSTDQEMEQNLQCNICCDLLHDCVSLQPCLHAFCGGCYSSWMKQSHECPTCRKKVNTVARNHMLNNLVNIFLQNHPEKKKSTEELAESDKNNTIKGNIVKVGGPVDNSYQYGYSEGSDEYSDSEDDNDNVVYGMMPPVFAGMPHLFAGMPPAVVAGVRPMCRECPGFTDPPGRYTTPATTSSQANPNQPRFTCGPQQQHLVCYCCMEMMPNQVLAPGAPKQKCEVCNSVYCHTYWRCRKTGCRGCLAKFKDIDFADYVLDTLVLRNTYESTVLKNYLQARSIDLGSFVHAICAKIDSGTYTLENDRDGTSFVGKNVNSSTHLCFRCGTKALAQLAYQYRKDIPAADLPDSVTSKDDCWWGKNCRTQQKPHHANSKNHICEQTKFD